MNILIYFIKNLFIFSLYIILEISGLEPEKPICKIDILPIKSYPLKKKNIYKAFILYPKNDSNVHDISSVKLKLTLSTNSSTRIYKIYIYRFIYICKARVI